MTTKLDEAYEAAHYAVRNLLAQWPLDDVRALADELADDDAGVIVDAVRDELQHRTNDAATTTATEEK
jgi:hypothetical protein